MVRYPPLFLHSLANSPRSYFESPPRFQALHCLRNRVTGGSSYFTDSYAALRNLKAEQPDHYAALRDQDVAFVYDNDGYWYYRRHRTVVEAPDNEGSKQVQFHAVNYSPPFQAPLPPSAKPETHDNLFAALAAFERLLARPEGLYEFTMQEGDLALFDNRRILHARRAFQNTQASTAGREGEATRWLKGCYMDGDVVWNKMRVMNRAVRTGEVEALPEWKEVIRKRGLLS
jgi:gamma-butyrobetaine dioxygenase